MQIAKHAVVTMDYTLKDDEGAVLDSSENGGAFSFILGIGGIIPGLEKALEGKTAGDKLSVSITPEDGYGARDDALLQSVPRQQFDSPQALEVGMQFQTQDAQGTQIVTVVAVDSESVTVDGNHPLAGVNLHFDVEVLDVRAATEEELSHGHVHGPGGHHH